MREEEAVVAFVAIVCGTALMFVVLNHLSVIAKKWIETALKRDMVARGYSADEIIGVVESDRPTGFQTDMGGVPPAKPVRQPAY